jgi:5-methyltetrahydrofolate--homocysteine methyltransferase
MDPKETLSNLAAAVIEGDSDKARENAREALLNKIDPLKAMEEGLSKGMAVVGENFESGETFLPGLLMASGCIHCRHGNPETRDRGSEETDGQDRTILIGTVKSDVHTIGKNIVATVLGTQGFEVVDIGIDNPSLKIIEEAAKVKADVIALSSLMTTTMPGQKEVIDTLKEMKLRDRYFVIVGGGPVTQEWADKIGADGYAKSAMQAAELVRKLMSEKR